MAVEPSTFAGPRGGGCKIAGGQHSARHTPLGPVHYKSPSPLQTRVWLQAANGRPQRQIRRWAKVWILVLLGSWWRHWGSGWSSAVSGRARAVTCCMGCWRLSPICSIPAPAASPAWRCSGSLISRSHPLPLSALRWLCHKLLLQGWNHRALPSLVRRGSNASPQGCPEDRRWWHVCA